LLGTLGTARQSSTEPLAFPTQVRRGIVFIPFQRARQQPHPLIVRLDLRVVKACLVATSVLAKNLTALLADGLTSDTEALVAEPE
jgi:hypothetical protein